LFQNNYPIIYPPNVIFLFYIILEAITTRKKFILFPEFLFLCLAKIILGYNSSLLLYFLALQIVFVIIIILISIIRYIPVDNKFTIYTNPIASIPQKIQKINLNAFLIIYFPTGIIAYFIKITGIPAIPTSMYDSVIDNTIMVVAGLGIFNLGALLALLQFNYNRFNSNVNNLRGSVSKMNGNLTKLYTISYISG
jgi:hypothetical protein